MTIMETRCPLINSRKLRASYEKKRIDMTADRFVIVIVLWVLLRMAR